MHPEESPAMVDLTERSEAGELFRLAVESAPHATVIVNHEDRVVMVNQRAEELFGYPRGELLGRSRDAGSRTHPEEARRFHRRCSLR